MGISHAKNGEAKMAGKIKVAVFIGAVLTLASAPVRAGVFWLGNDLYNMCTNGGSASEGACLGFTVAVADAVEMLAPGTVCMPPNMVTGQARDIVVKWLRDHPEQRHVDALSLVVFAFRDAFPCAPKQ